MEYNHQRTPSDIDLEKTMSGKFAAQLSVFQKHHLVSEQTSIDALLVKFDKRTNHGLDQVITGKSTKKSAY